MADEELSPMSPKSQVKFAEEDDTLEVGVKEDSEGHPTFVAIQGQRASKASSAASPKGVGFAEEDSTLEPLMGEDADGRPTFLQIESRQMSKASGASRKKSSVAALTSPTIDAMRKLSTQFIPIDPSDENQERGNWDNPIEFVLSCLGYIVGLGNIWRFPYLVYRNGGGVFFVAYFSMLFLCGMPMVLMELIIGQYWSQGSLTVWKLAPLFKGIGFSMSLLSFFCMIYYCMITGWALYYFFYSLRAHLPWACCDAAWATPNCVSFVQDQPQCNGTGIPGVPDTKPWTNTSKFAADEYFHEQVLGISDGLHEIGGIQWHMFLSLAIAWLIVFLVLIRGVKTLGKFSYITTTLPYCVLLTLLIKAQMEDGAYEGVVYYFTPDWSRLGTAQIWNDAATQIFYSSGVCFGGVITLASFNNRDHNVFRDACILALGDCFTSMFSGSVVFSILGFMAFSQNTTVDAVVTSGSGLAFIAYPQAVTLLTASPVWSTLFFFMLSLLALSSMFPMVENVSSAIIDQFREQLKDWKFWVTAVVCFISFLIGISLTAEGGMFVLQVFDNYAVGKALLFVGFVEASVLGWVYGGGRLLMNMESMMGHYRILIIYKYIWIFVSPVVLLFAIGFSLAQESPAEYGGYVFEPWGVAIGWTLTIIAIIPIPAYAIWRVISYKQEFGRATSWWDCVKTLCLPSENIRLPGGHKPKGPSLAPKKNQSTIN